MRFADMAGVVLDRPYILTTLTFFRPRLQVGGCCVCLGSSLGRWAGAGRHTCDSDVTLERHAPRAALHPAPDLPVCRWAKLLFSCSVWIDSQVYVFGSGLITLGH
jgi:hypothetical protein